MRVWKYSGVLAVAAMLALAGVEASAATKATRSAKSATSSVDAATVAAAASADETQTTARATGADAGQASLTAGTGTTTNTAAPAANATTTTTAAAAAPAVISAAATTATTPPIGTTADSATIAQAGNTTDARTVLAANTLPADGSSNTEGGGDGGPVARPAAPPLATIGGCDCAQIVAQCAASVAVVPTSANNGIFAADVTLQTDAPACAKVGYRIDDTDYLTVLRNGPTGTQRLTATRPLTRTSVSQLSCQVCTAKPGPVANDGLPPNTARDFGASNTVVLSAMPPAPPPPAATDGAPTAPTATTTTVANDTAAPATTVAANTPPPAPAPLVNPAGRWRGMCTNAPPWWGLTGEPMTRLMALALNGTRVSGTVDDVEPNVHTTVQGTLDGTRLQLAGTFGHRHDITLSADGATLTDAWCNGDGRCRTCDMQRF